MKNTTAQKYNNRLHAIFDTARDQKKKDNALPLEYAAGTIGNARRGVVAMLPRGAWGYDDEIGRLIAAAPDLLAALRETIRQFPARDKMHTLQRVAFDDARAAIAKATGGAK